MRCLDFYAPAPLAATPDMWLDRLVAETEDGFGFILSGRENELGYGAIATPMTLMGLATALEKFGTRKLADLIGPAIHYAEAGFMVRPHVSAYWNQVPTEGRAPHADFLTRFAPTRKIYARPDGRLHAVGDTLVNRDMAATLRRIAAAGAGDFYRGEIAARIAADMGANGGLLAAADLAASRVEETQPLWGSYRGLKIATNPPPGGGVMLLEMLNILEHFDLRALGHNSPAYIAIVAEAMKIGAVDRDQHLGDPRFVDVPVERLLSKEHAVAMAARIKRGEKTNVPRLGAKEARTPRMCAWSIATACASRSPIRSARRRVSSPTASASCTTARWARSTRARAAPRSIAPGKARVSSMAPSIVFNNGKPFFVVGAPGGTYITPGILQAILNVVDFGMSALEAISAPRFCATSDTIWLTNRILRSAERDLKARGYPVRRSPQTYYFAGVHGIRIVDGVCDGAADPGRDGMALAV